MKHLNEYMSTETIKAETLLSLCNIEENFNVRMAGIFSRNYSEDIINIDNEDDKTTVVLSRDGLFHLLPEGLFFEERMLQNSEKCNFDFKSTYTEFKKRKKEIETFFQPFDTTYFKLNLELEYKLNNFTKIGNDIFIDSFLDISEIDTNNKYIAALKTLLPFTCQLRGNIVLLIDILKNILSVEKIDIKEIALFYTRFIIHKENLSKEEYIAMDNDLRQFFDFFCQWFLPVERKYDYRIKDYKQPFVLKDSLILDYNTHL